MSKETPIQKFRQILADTEKDDIAYYSTQSGVGQETIENFIAGGDMLLSDASKLIDAMNGDFIFIKDWVDLRQNMLAEIDNEHCIYVSEDFNPGTEIYFESFYPRFDDIIFENRKEFSISGIPIGSLKKIIEYVKEKRVFDFTIFEDNKGYELKDCTFISVNPYSKMAILKFEDIIHQKDSK